MIEFLRTNARWISGGFLLTFFSSFGQTFFIGLSGEELREKFNLTDGEFGGIYMIATIGSALTLPFLGRVLDHMPGWKVARFVIPALAMACVLMAYSPSPLMVHNNRYWDRASLASKPRKHEAGNRGSVLPSDVDDFAELTTGFQEIWFRNPG